LKLESQLRTALTIVKIRNSVLGRHGVACRRAEAYQSQELPSFLIGQAIASELCFLRHRLLQLQIFRRDDVTSASSTLLLATAVASNTRSPSDVISCTTYSSKHWFLKTLIPHHVVHNTPHSSKPKSSNPKSLDPDLL
jgi:hypothetical protein